MPPDDWPLKAVGVASAPTPSGWCDRTRLLWPMHAAALLAVSSTAPVKSAAVCWRRWFSVVLRCLCLRACVMGSGSLGCPMPWRRQAFICRVAGHHIGLHASLASAVSVGSWCGGHGSVSGFGRCPGFGGARGADGRCDVADSRAWPSQPTPGVLLITLVVMLLVHPAWARSIGFQLSAAATAGLVISAGPIEQQLRSWCRRSSRVWLLFWPCRWRPCCGPCPCSCSTSEPFLSMPF